MAIDPVTGQEVQTTEPGGYKPELDEHGVPLKNRVEEYKRQLEEAKIERENAKREADMLRDQALRAAATPAPRAEPEPEEDLTDLFTTNPNEAVKKMIAKERGKITAEIEGRSRRIFILEAKKIEAMQRYPALRDARSDFFKKVEYFMNTHPEKYNEAEGLLDACARVAQDSGTPTPAAEKATERVVAGVSSAGSHISGSGSAPVTDNPELDAKGLELASKLGIDPKVMAQRLADLKDGKGEYAPGPGKTGKATYKG